MIHPDPDYTALYESIAWILNDIMDDIADLLDRGHDGAARDHAQTTRALFAALPDQEQPMPIHRRPYKSPPTAEHIINKVATAHGWTTTTERGSHIQGERTHHHKNNTWISVQYTDNANRAVLNAWRTNYDTENTDTLTGRDPDKRETILDWLMALA